MQGPSVYLHVFFFIPNNCQETLNRETRPSLKCAFLKPELCDGMGTCTKNRENPVPGKNYGLFFFIDHSLPLQLAFFFFFFLAHI
jgi:hypothetical protein